MLFDTIQDDLKQAQLQRDGVATATLRMLVSEIRYSAISKSEDRQDISDEAVIQVIQKEAKKRREAIISFQQGGREELAQKEEAELHVLERYLPEQLGDDELRLIIQSTVQEIGIQSVTEMGKIMSAVMPKVAGKADGSRVSALVKEMLSS